MIDITRTQKSLAGEFAVLSQLSLRGLDANLTLGTTKSVDILVSNPSSGNMCRIEVKTTATLPSQGGAWGRAIHWIMGQKHDNINDPKLFFAFVHIEEDGKQFRFFIVPSILVGRYCYESHQNWLNDINNRIPQKTHDSERRVFRIALDDDGHYSVDTPKASQFEDAWNLLG